MSIVRGFRPPVSDSAAGTRAPLDLPWLGGPCVAVAPAVAAAPLVVGPLPRGVYYVWVSEAAWINAGIGAPGLDHTLTTAGSTPEALEDAPWAHEGGYWPVAVDDGESIAVKAMNPAKPTHVRIHKGA